MVSKGAKAKLSSSLWISVVCSKGGGAGVAGISGGGGGISGGAGVKTSAGVSGGAIGVGTGISISSGAFSDTRLPTSASGTLSVFDGCTGVSGEEGGEGAPIDPGAISESYKIKYIYIHIKTVVAPPK